MPDSKDSKEDLLRARPWQILGILPTAMLLGVLTGVLTNVINAWLSPLYFTAQFPAWQGNSDFQVWLLALAQGALEGVANGTGVGLVLMFGLGFMSKLRCPLQLAVKVQMRIIAISLIFGCIFGFNAIVIALFVPQFYDLFLGLPAGLLQKLKFAWVSGSIIGFPIGAMVGTVNGLMAFALQWKMLMKQIQE